MEQEEKSAQQEAVLKKMLNDASFSNIPEELLKNIQPYRNDQLTAEQYEFSKYICSILYKLIDADKTLKEHDLLNRMNFYISGFENACIITHPSYSKDNADRYSVVFGPNLFKTYQNLKKYKKTQNQNYLAELKGKEKLTEDDIASVLAHELGHTLMKIQHPKISHKLNEEGADIYALNLLQKAGYSPTAISKFFTAMALESEYQKDENIAQSNKLLIYAIDEHASMENRKLIADGYLLKHRQDTGENWNAIPTVEIPSDIDFFKTAKTFTIKKIEKEKKEEPLSSDFTLRHYSYSYDEVLKALQNNFTPQNLNLLLETHQTFIPNGRGPEVRFDSKSIKIEQKIHDILTTCPYHKIYEENDEVDPKLLSNARTFIDLISKPKKDFLFPKGYYYQPEEHSMTKHPAYDQFSGTAYKSESGENLYSKTTNFSTTVNETFYLYTSDLLLDENRYQNLDVEELIKFRETGYFDHHVKNFLDAFLLKRILEEKDENKKLSYLLPLLNSNNAFGEYQTRQIYCQETANLLAKKYGVDDGSLEYQNKIEQEVLKPYFISDDTDYSSLKIVSNPLAKDILDRFSRKTVSKRNLSLKMEEIIQQNNEISLGSYTQGRQGATEAALEMILEDSDASDTLIDFLSHDYDVSHVYNYVQRDILEKVDIGIKKKDLMDAIVAQSRYEDSFNETIDTFYQIHSMFWNSDISVRTAILTKMLSSTKKNSEELFAYSIEKLIPAKTKNRQFLTDVIASFISTYDETERPFLMAAMLSAQKKQNSSSKFSVGEPLKEFLENIGPAGIKLGQALGSSPSVPEDIRKVMQQMKHSASQPSRWELYHLYDSSVPEDKQKEIGKVIGSGSYFIAVETNDSVYSLLRSHAKARAEDAFNQMQKMCTILKEKKEKKYTDFAQIFSGIVEKASAMSEIETDLNIGKIQDQMARQIYHNPDGTDKTLILDSEKPITATLHVADWLSFGETYKETKKVSGTHFNDLNNPDFKRGFSKAYLQLELENLFGGNPFDHDRHGAQMKIEQIDETHYNIGIFDNGAMSDRPPTKEEQRQLGNVLNEILNSLPDIGNPLEILKYYSSGKKGFAETFNDAIQKESKDGKASDYLLSVQRGMLALNDYMRNLSNAEVLSVITESIKKTKETTNSAVVTSITDQNLKKLDKIVSFLSKHEKKKEESQTEIKTETVGPTTSEELSTAIKRIRKNAKHPKAGFTLSRDMDFLTRKMGLTHATRSKVARATNLICSERKKFRIHKISSGVASVIGGIFLSASTAMAASALSLSPSPLTLLTCCFATSAAFFSGLDVSDFKPKSLTKPKMSDRIFKIADKLKEKNLHRSLSDLQKKGKISLNSNQPLSSVAFVTQLKETPIEQKKPLMMLKKGGKDR